MADMAGYVRAMARFRVGEQQTKSWLGNPYIKYGQCHALWSYFFQLGGILGAKHRAGLDDFARAFLGVRGDPGAARQFFTLLVNERIEALLKDPMDFSEYVAAEFLQRVGYTSDWASYLLTHGRQKLKPRTAEELAWQYASDGAALGAICPDKVRTMFQRAHAVVPKERWEQARAAGLDIPPEQDVMSYAEVEEEEDSAFLSYCRECYPDLCAGLLACGG